MGTPGSGRKRAPIKDRFSAEDEALGSIAREAEARLAAKRAARAEARDIRMRELERQQKELSRHSSDRKWGQINQWMEDTEKAKYGHRSSGRHHRAVDDDVMPVRSVGSYRHSSSSLRDVSGSHNSRANTSRRRDLVSDSLKDKSSTKSSRSSSSSYSASYGVTSTPVSSNSRKDLLSGYYHDQRNYSSLKHSKPVSSYHTRLDDKSDKHFTDSFTRPVSRNAVPGLSAAALASLGGTSSRRGSGDTGSIVDPDASLSELRDIYDLKDQIQDVEGRYMQGLKELKDSLTEVEEKYKKAMVSNAQLDNEKANLIYQVDTLKDVIEEMEELMAEMHRETEDKSKELERQKHTCNVLQHKIEELKEGVRQRDELIEENQGMQQKLDSRTREVFDLQETINWKDKKIGALERQKEYFDCIRNERDELRDELAVLNGKMKTGEKHGLVIIPEGMPNGDLNHEPVVGAITVVTQEAAQVLESAGEGPLDVRLRKLADEKEELIAQIRKLKMQLEEERQKSSKIESVLTDGERLENGTDLQFIEMQRDANRQISEYKFKLSKAEQEMCTMEQNINRLEGQVSRYKASSENSEKIEDELKAEKRRLQRELRTSLDKIEEMEMTNSHLVKRLEKMKANRNAILSQQ
ncbi:leucine-rich repeat flightless-interacting protein 2-like isoform X12 [Acipenser ruthenus]|uniref:leucine-rich repeat flightless-interacting protein 2-like isoform X12 n=1 Tax=Acipenser ruthenus TaxID=7906 RepID=UPI00274049E6|nr:leucine-rich repeat flightless-interacting protein 2-like isoform X12 [Acipenser ruthenus]